MTLIKTFIFIFLSSTLFTQEDESCLPPNKKTLKLVEAAEKKANMGDAVKDYTEAMKLAPDNAYVTYSFAMYMYNNALDLYDKNPNPAAGDRSFEGAKNLFIKTLEFCPDYHGNCTYYLGVYYYTKREMPEAINYFKKFLAFQHEDPNRYPNDYDKKVNDVREVIKEFEETETFLSESVPFSPKIVENVSSSNDEYFPMISPDNELIFYTRKLNRSNLGDGAVRSTKTIEELTFSSRPDINALFDKGQALKPPFNDGSFTNYGSATLSVDNKEMIICACKTEVVYGQNYLNCDLYSTIYERTGNGGNDFKWSPLVNLGPEINTVDGWEAQPSLSADGNTLFYTVARPTSRDNDIYIVKRKADGTWGTPRPFDEINTDGKDKSPFLHQDSETLYFVSTCSDTRKGAGGLDIFYIREEKDGKWSKPKNIGSPINTPGDELGIFVSTDGHYAYYSSKQGPDWNIYYFELYEEARPKSVAIIKGELKDENGTPIENASVEITYANSDEVSKIKVNGNDGKYAAVIKTDVAQDVMVTVKKDNAAFDSKLISKEQLSKPVVTHKENDLTVKELKAGEAYTLHDILYQTNSSVLSDKSKFVLKQFAKFLKEHPSISITIQGHTDDIGDDQQNQILSEQRAKGVSTYLISLGIDQNRLNAKGFGETMPKVENNSEKNRAVNRRTDFVIEKI